jgi:hypothetical protein
MTDDSHQAIVRRLFEEGWNSGDVASVSGMIHEDVWNPSGTTKDRTFTDRAGRQRPYELTGQGVSLTEVIDRKVTRHDMFWPRRSLFP